MSKIIEIPLTQGKVAVIDAEDAEKVLQYKWTTVQTYNRKKVVFYARRGVKKAGQKQQTVLLHRFLLNAPKGIQVDHKNGNGLDNRRENLRLATNSQNHCNIAVKKSNTGFRGVAFSKNKKRFYARVKLNGKMFHAGVFDTAIEAALAYDAKAKELHGEFATLNFPENINLEGEQSPQAGSAFAANILPALSDSQWSDYADHFAECQEVINNEIYRCQLCNLPSESGTEHNECHQKEQAWSDYVAEMDNALYSNPEIKSEKIGSFRI